MPTAVGLLPKNLTRPAQVTVFIDHRQATLLHAKQRSSKANIPARLAANNLMTERKNRAIRLFTNNPSLYYLAIIDS
jgi:hypothetical protein